MMQMKLAVMQMQRNVFKRLFDTDYPTTPVPESLMTFRQKAKTASRHLQYPTSAADETCQVA
jgi:hypothetical protein